MAFADRVVTEYKKFMFLAVVAGHTVSPSVEVDQAWHLHLVYMQSYWREFCGEVLQQPVHHGPTKGGQQEQDKFVDLYERTKQSYQAFFGESPPQDIWPSSKIRFDTANGSKWISSKNYWIIRKPNFSKLFTPEAFPIAVGAAIPLLVAWSPYELSGKYFLLFYAIVALLGAIVALVLQGVSA